MTSERTRVPDGDTPRPTYDPLTAKRDDPWTALAEDRARCPVAHGPLPGMVEVTGYEALAEVLRDWAAYSSTGTVGAETQEILAFCDPPEHTRQRRLFSAALSARRVDDLEPAIQERADRLIDGLEGRDSFDVVEEYANPLVLGVIVRLMGVPESDIPRFREWTKAGERNAYGGTSEDRRALREFADYIRDKMAERRTAEEAPDDFMTALLEAEWEGERLTDSQITEIIGFLLVAANSTTTDAIGNLVWALESHPDEKAKFLADPQRKVPSAVEEILRYDGPIHALMRTVTTDTTLAGQEIPAGTVMLNVYGAASHDPDAYDAPDEFGVDRDWGSIPHHWGFGWGLHFCLGAHLARREIAVAVETLYRRLPNLRAQPGFTPSQVEAPFLRGWNDVRVRFDPPIRPRATPPLRTMC